MSNRTHRLLLDEILRNVTRRYLVSLTPALQGQDAGSAALVAIAIEAARVTIDQGDTPNEAAKQRFLQALAHMIHNAMQVNSGDPTFQALVLEHHAQQVRQYASLSAQATQDRRLVLAAVNTVAHPAKLERSNSAKKREVLSRLHEAASSQSWTTLHATAQHIIESPEIQGDPGIIRSVTRIRDNAALARLIRTEELGSDQRVQHYRALRNQNVPRSGNDDAAAQGRTSKKRGAGVEALAAQALQSLADLLNRAEGSPDTYRIATSLHVPAVLMIDAHRSKAEWDVVLLRNAPMSDVDDPVWSICLLVEAKASANAATTDFPRLLRGLKLLAQADSTAIYSFEAQEGTVRVHGASMNALTTNEAELKRTVLYCTDAPAKTMPRPLNPASRMQLLTASASLEFAGRWAGRYTEGLANKEANSLINDQADHAAGTQKNNLQADLKILEPVWYELLESSRWRPVLNQYQTLRQVRELMVHPDDLISAIHTSSSPPQ